MKRTLKVISQEAGPAASGEALLAVAPYFRISRKRGKQILEEVERAVSTWRDLGAALGMRQADLADFADAFEHDGPRR